MRYTLWLIPEVFEAIWRDQRNYVVSEAIRALCAGDVLLIEEGDEAGHRTGRVMQARVEAVTPARSEGLPRDLCVFQVRIESKRSRP